MPCAPLDSPRRWYPARIRYMAEVAVEKVEEVPVILFLHGLESGPNGRKARELRRALGATREATVLSPYLEAGTWQPDRSNSIARRAFAALTNAPWLALRPDRLLNTAIRDALEACAEIARQCGPRPESFSPASTTLVGSSWGGAVALWMLAQGGEDNDNVALAHVVLIAPALERALGAIESELLYRKVRERRLRLGDAAGVVVVVHGTDDDTVSYEDSVRLCETLGVDLISVPGGDHRLNEALLGDGMLVRLVREALARRSSARY